CTLCRRAEADPDICGRKLQKQGLCAHEFCLYFANELYQQWLKEPGLIGFLPEDIRRTVERATQKHCFVCGESGATIACRDTHCHRSFHLPCAVEGGCVTQFLFQFRSRSLVLGAQRALSSTRASLLLLLFLLQGQAVRNGICSFQCPLCRDRDAFLTEMLVMGIRVPFRLPSQDSQVDAALSERHSRCDASDCVCPGGREQAEEEGPWELLLCSSCAAEGTHVGCSNLSSSMDSWECDGC
ncbi:PHD finger protein 7, partial [Opisthocomus hoazin]